MLDLYLIRHAESEMNLNNHLVSGRSNESPLSLRGIHQAVLLGRRLDQESVKFDRAYSSIAVRALDTARIVCPWIGYSIDEIVQSERLVEMSKGEWEGKPRMEIFTPEIMKSLETYPFGFKPPEGESQLEVEIRMYDWLYGHIMPNEHLDSLTIGVFSHGTAIKCLLRGLLDFNPKITYKMVLDNTSITRLKYSKGSWQVLTVNDAAHLLGESKTEDLGY